MLVHHSLIWDYCMIISKRLRKRIPVCGLTINLSTLDLVADDFRTSAVNLTPNTESGAKDLEHRSLQFLRQTLEPHCPRDVDDLLQGNRFAVLDVLFLLPVSWRFFQGSDD